MRWTLSVAAAWTAVALGACGGDGGPASDTDPGPLNGYDERVATALCADFCALTNEAGCGLKSAVICAHDFPDLASPDGTAGCGVAGQEDCPAACVAAYADSTRPQACLGAKLRFERCLFATCQVVSYIQTGFEDLSPDCADAKAAEDAACASIQAPCPENPAEQCPSDGPYMALDIQNKDFDRASATTLCPAEEMADQANLTLQLFAATRNGLESLGPDDKIGQRFTPLSELMTPGALAFTLPSNADAVAPPHNAYLDGAGPSGVQGLTVAVNALRYEPLGGASRAADERLVILLVDRSGSLKGQPDPALAPDPTRASDPNDLRITFLKQLVTAPTVSPDAYFSLVWFQDRQPVITAEFATPTRNRDVMACPPGEAGTSCRADPAMDGLSKLEREESGGTPLGDALWQTYNIVVNAPQTAALAPLVILLTDGVEDGDTSPGGHTIDDAIEQYAGHTTEGGTPSPVSVVVLHLSAKPTEAGAGPDAGLQRLACRTGGEYIYLARASDFGAVDLLPRIIGRLDGTWRVDLGLPGVPAVANQWGRFTTDIGLTLDDRQKTTALQAPAGGSSEWDARPIYWP